MSGLRRRSFLAGLAASTGGLVSAQLFGDSLRQASFGAVGGNTVVVVSLRGGIDGMGVVVPHGDPDYYAARPTIAIPAASLVAKDAMFGLHPGLAVLEPWWNSGEMAAVHAVGMAIPNRSHFSAMEQVEDADPGAPERIGWLNRMVGLAHSANPLQAVQVGSPLVPVSLEGPAATMATNNLTQLRIPGLQQRPAERYSSLRRMWAGSGGPLEAGAEATFTISQDYAGGLQQTYTPANGAEYLANDFGNAMMDTAKLIKAEIGTEVVAVETGGWDMHASYGSVSSGQMMTMLPRVAKVLHAFMTDLGPELRSRVTLVTISEFGRRLAENGNVGLDHGWGNMMLAMGAGVRGGRYYARWPWLAPGKLQDGDLKVTTDYRNVLGEVISRRFPDRSLSTVFPGLSHSPIGLMS